MKVLFISSLYYPHVGGIETVITELSSEYAGYGIRSVVLTKKWPSQLSSYSRYKGMPIYRILSTKNNNDFFKTIKWVMKNENKIRCDIIHVIGMRRPLPLFALFLARRWQVPLVSTIAGSELPEESDKRTYDIWNSSKDIMVPVLSQSDAVTAFSKGLIENAHKQIELKSQKIKLLYAGMHVSQFTKVRKTQFDQPYIVCVRRLVISKGIDILIMAFKKFSFKVKRVTLVIVGDGPEKERLVALTKKLGIGSRVKFVGTVSLKKVASLLKGAIMTVVPSRSEGGGLINIEAQASGCPLIVARVGGIPEYVQSGKTGLLFKVGNNDLLYKKMIYLYGNLAKRNALIKNGKRFVKKFDWKILVPQYIKLYSEIIENYISKPFLPWSMLTRKLCRDFQ